MDDTNINNQMPTFPPTPAPMPTPEPEKKSKKPLIIVAIVVLVALIAGAVAWGLMQGKSNQQNTKLTGNDSNNPNNIDGIAVNTYRYVNACRALEYDTVIKKHFASAPKGGTLYNVFAEDGLPVKDIDDDSPNTPGVTSECHVVFIEGGKYGGGELTFTIHQLSTADAAKKFYEDQYESATERQDRERLNQEHGYDFSDSSRYKPMAGVKNTLFNDAEFGGGSLTLHDNKIIKFGIFGGGESQATFKQSIIAALPDVIKNIDDDTLPQAALAENSRDKNGKRVSSYGQKIGSSTYTDPCKVFTGEDFKTLTDKKADPSSVEVFWHWDPINTLAGKIDRGLTKNNCKRVQYPGKQGKGKVDVYVMYFKTAQQAQDTLKQRIKDLSRPGRILGHFTNVSGVGGYAAYKIQGEDDGLPNHTGFYVQKDSYVLEINATSFDRYGDNRKGRAISLDSYKKAVAAMLERLP